MGWYGYHRSAGKRPDGFWDQKSSIIKAMMSDQVALDIAAPDYGDIEAYPKEPIEPYETFTKLQHFE